MSAYSSWFIISLSWFLARPDIDEILTLEHLVTFVVDFCLLFVQYFDLMNIWIFDEYFLTITRRSAVAQKPRNVQYSLRMFLS